MTLEIRNSVCKITWLSAKDPGLEVEMFWMLGVGSHHMPLIRSVSRKVQPRGNERGFDKGGIIVCCLKAVAWGWNGLVQRTGCSISHARTHAQPEGLMMHSVARSWWQKPGHLFKSFSFSRHLSLSISPCFSLFCRSLSLWVSVFYKTNASQICHNMICCWNEAVSSRVIIVYAWVCSSVSRMVNRCLPSM